MNNQIQFGKLAQSCGYQLKLEVLQSNAGYYIGTFCYDNSEDYGPCSRESEEYFGSKNEAQYALDNNTWTQR